MIPLYYDYENLINASRNPSAYHISNNYLFRYFQRRLLKKAISTIEFENIPKNWDKNYFQYVLFICGYVAVIETDKFGVIPQQCYLGGFNVQYQPVFCSIANPKLKGIIRPVIHEDCEIIKLQPDYRGVLDLVDLYASKLALASESADMNLWASKLAYVFFAENKSSAESFKKLFDKIMNGEVAVVQDKKLLTDDGKPSWDVFTQNLSQNYITDKILDDMRKLESQFLTEIGIQNVDMKKERMVVDEANKKSQESQVNIDLWLDNINESLKLVNEMFNLDIKAKKRYEVENDYVEEKAVLE